MQSIHPSVGDVSTARPRSRRGIRRAATLGLAAILITVLTACETVWPVRVANLTAADRAATWLVTDYQSNGSGYGASADADLILALTAVDGDRAVIQQALTDLSGKAAAYANPGGTVNPGATAKVMLAVQAARANPNAFAGLDLEAMLRGTLLTSGADTGRFGTSSAFTQSYAILALGRTSAGAPANAVAWLAAQQCPNGGFAYGDCNYVDPGTTGLAVTALIAGGSTNAVDLGRSWLEGNQNADGGYGSGGASDANSTGLVTGALRKLGDTTRADSAATYIRGIQYGTGAGAKAGAIPWQSGTDGSLLMATVQGVLAFGAGPLNEIRTATVIGTACPGTTGVTEVVDLTRFDNTIRIACATGPQTSGWNALVNAGFNVGAVPGYQGSAICTINSFPSEGYPSCWNDGYWAYWVSETNNGTWSFASQGPGARVPPTGSVEGWRYEPDWQHHDAAQPGIPAPVH